MPSGESATAGPFSSPANCWPGCRVIVKRLTGGGGEGFRFQIANPVRAAISSDTVPHKKASRHGARIPSAAPVGANVTCEPLSFIHFFPFHLLRRHVLKRPNNSALFGGWRLLRRRRHRGHASHRRCRLGQSKIQKFG